MKIMKQDQSAILRRPEFAGLALSHKLYPGRLVIRSIAVGAIITLTAAQAADAPNVGEPASQAALIQKPAYTPQGYQMERYKAFARQTEVLLPPPSVGGERHSAGAVARSWTHVRPRPSCAAGRLSRRSRGRAHNRAADAARN